MSSKHIEPGVKLVLMLSNTLDKIQYSRQAPSVSVQALAIVLRGCYECFGSPLALGEVVRTSFLGY